VSAYFGGSAVAMAALEGRALGVGPSKVLLQVLGITGHAGATTVSPAFVAALQQWDVAGGAPREYDSVASLVPAHSLGAPTTDVLLYLVDVCKEVKGQWREAPAASLLPPFLFQFFGFFDRTCVTSPLQLYRKAKNMRSRELPLLAGNVDACRIYLHGPCFEAPPVSRRSSTSSRDSTGSEDRREADRLASERRRHQREVIRLDAKKAELDAARAETTQQTAALRMQRQDQTLVESRLLAAEVQLVEREARCAEEEVSAVEAHSEAVRLEKLYRNAVNRATAADERRKQLTTLRRADQAAVAVLQRELAKAKRARKSITKRLLDASAAGREDGATSAPARRQRSDDSDSDFEPEDAEVDEEVDETRLFTARGPRGPTDLGMLRILLMLTRGMSAPLIVAQLKDELCQRGDHLQVARVVCENYIKTRAEAGVTFNAAIVAIALAGCDSYTYIHDGKSIHGIQINSGIFVIVKDGVKLHHMTVGSTRVANGTAAELLADFERSIDLCVTSLEAWRHACVKDGIDATFLPKLDRDTAVAKCDVSMADHAATAASEAVLDAAAHARQKLIDNGRAGALLCRHLIELGGRPGVSTNCVNHAAELGYNQGAAADKLELLKLLVQENGGVALTALQAKYSDPDYAAREISTLLQDGSFNHYLNVGRTAYAAYKREEYYRTHFKDVADVALLRTMGQRFLVHYQSWACIAPQIEPFTRFLLMPQTNMLQINTVEPLRSLVVVFAGLGRAVVYWQICQPLRFIIKSALVSDSKWRMLAAVVPQLMKLLDAVGKDGSILTSFDSWPLVDIAAESVPEIVEWHAKRLRRAAKTGMEAPFLDVLAAGADGALARKARLVVVQTAGVAFPAQFVKTALGDVLSKEAGGTGRFTLERLDSDPSLSRTLATTDIVSDLAETANGVASRNVQEARTATHARSQGNVAMSMNGGNAHETANKRGPYQTVQTRAHDVQASALTADEAAAQAAAAEAKKAVHEQYVLRPWELWRDARRPQLLSLVKSSCALSRCKALRDEIRVIEAKAKDYQLAAQRAEADKLRGAPQSVPRSNSGTGAAATSTSTTRRHSARSRQ